MALRVGLAGYGPGEIDLPADNRVETLSKPFRARVSLIRSWSAIHFPASVLGVHDVIYTTHIARRGFGERTIALIEYLAAQNHQNLKDLSDSHLSPRRSPSTH